MTIKQQALPMPAPAPRSNIEKLKQLQKEVEELLRQSERFDYLETGDCLDVLNFAHEILPGVIAQHPEQAP